VVVWVAFGEETFKRALMRVLKESVGAPAVYLSREVEVDVTFPAGTPPGTEAILEVYPPDGMFAIRFFRLKTPLDVEANIVVVLGDGLEVVLLGRNQDEGVEEVYSADDWSTSYIYARAVKLYAVAKRDVSVDRTVTLSFTGGLV
jgi:hypothetical protein